MKLETAATMRQPRSVRTERSIDVRSLAWVTIAAAPGCDLRAMRPAFVARTAVGVAKYGTSLCTHNGRSATVDSFQEAFDLVQYLAQEEIEAPDAATAEEVSADLDAACRLLVRIAKRVSALPEPELSGETP